ncbi:MAG: FAD-dependent monooxygenase [Leptothrix sp. (in: b-proteobacteria)]
MHQPTTEPRRSIYYQYQVHPATLRPAAAALGQPDSAPVVIAGAGPAGLVTALALAQQGVRTVLLESQLQVSEGSRAIVFTRRSMEILQQVGAADAVVRSALPWRFGNSFYRGERVFRMEAPHDADQRFFPMTNLQQQYLEEYLFDAVAEQPLIELRWGHALTRILRHDGERAEFEVDTPGGSYVQQADWLVAADGARSGIRQMLDLRMEGAAYEGRFVIADIRVDLPLPTERLAFFDPVWNPGNTVLMHREPHGIWRIDYQLPAGETPEQALAPESLKARIDAQLAMVGHKGKSWELDWCSVYSARAMTLPDYVHGRVVFVGDAAHMLPIFGVRGANTGFQDAQNLGWKLGLVAKGVAPLALLNSYSTERVGAAREIIDEAGKSTRFMTPPSRGFRLLRDAVLSLSLSEAFVRPLFHWRTSRPHVHADSALNDPGDDNALFSAGPADGAPLPNLRLADDDYLLDHLCGSAAGAFTLLLFAPQAALDPVVQAWRQRGVLLQVLQLPDPQGRLRQHLGVPGDGAAYLLRPDQHVCARWLNLTPDRLDAALHRID